MAMDEAKGTCELEDGVDEPWAGISMLSTAPGPLWEHELRMMGNCQPQITSQTMNTACNKMSGGNMGW